MRSIDYHMHTRFSGDSEADPREHVIQAIKMRFVLLIIVILITQLMFLI